ncbi:MAG: FAD-binding oxidoreductase [Anaerolineae bacterium]|nr:FAD-binding oxidoreductase [Anaerolineae bacterium]
MTSQFSLRNLTPKNILVPHDADELAQLLAQCNAEKSSVVPWGGGTLQHLGNPPARYDNVLQTTRLNQVIEYAADDLTATFGAGMTIDQIARILAENGQFLPLDVPHPERATLGGVLAAGVNGPLRLRYGPTRDYMLGNRFATVDGSIIKAGSKVVKNVAGYELHKVQVGAFGTLGILTEATFKVFPKPPAEISVLASFENLADACAAVPPLWNLNTPPLAIEFLDAVTVRMVEPGAQGAWFVVARFGGPHTTMAAARDLCGQIAKEKNAFSVSSVTTHEKFWRALADIPATLVEQFPDALLMRVSVPPKEFKTAAELLLSAAAAQNIPAPRLFAHAALASIYASFDGDASALAALVTALRAQLHSVGGHLMLTSAPPPLENLDRWQEVGPALKMMQSLKSKFDPNNILNPCRFVGGI